MKLVGDWRRILRKSWAIRATVLCGALMGLVVGLPLLEGIMPPMWLFWAVVVANIAAPVAARLFKQRSISGD